MNNAFIFNGCNKFVISKKVFQFCIIKNSLQQFQILRGLFLSGLIFIFIFNESLRRIVESVSSGNQG